MIKEILKTIFSSITVLVLFSSFLSAQPGTVERIISFDSEITINKDASMIVTETIKVHAEGMKIKRGIYRDFPTEYEDAYGNSVSIKFEVIEVLKNGKQESYHTENISNGIRVYVGKSNVFLNPGDYTYTIKYLTSRQLGFFEDFDELYWNVTGNGWDFKIENVTAVVKLPENVLRNKINTLAFTGRMGAKGKNFLSEISSGGAVKFKTTKSLMPREGLTIVVQFPKGIVTEPSASEKLGYFIEDNKSVLIGIIGLIILFLYYLIVWWRVGIDPKGGVIIPLFEPPKNLSPAAVRFIYEMGFDNKVFTAAVINLAVKGAIKIKDDDGEYTLIKNENSTVNLSNEEKKLLAKLKFKTGSSDSEQLLKLELKQKNHKLISSAIKAVKKSLKNSFEKHYFITNKKFFIIGIIFSVIIIIVSSLSGTAEQLFMLFWITFWSAGVAMLMFTVFKAWRGALNKRKGRAAALGGAIFITLFSIPFLIGEIVGLFFLSEAGSPLLIVIIGLLALINVIFYHLLKAPTLLGRKILDSIEGFKMYLATAEQDRLNNIQLPKKTPQLFEKYLPYALALGVENKWSEKFAGIISAAGSGDDGYSPSWYSGAAWSTIGAAGFTSSLSSGFSSAISSSSTAPGSSSGGSGGFSGGGGGGGGGGGW